MFESGYWKVGSIRGVPLRFHWTIPVGAFLFGGFRFVPAFWIGFVLIVLVHEIGHALVVWRYRHQVVSIDVTGFGGLCRWSGNPTPFGRAAIAWGGVLAQSVLLAVAYALLLFGVWRVVPFGGELASVFIFTNLWLMVLNLIPIRPLDGYEAWPLLGMLPGELTRWARRRHGKQVWDEVMKRPVPKRRYVRKRTPQGAVPEPDGPPEDGRAKGGNGSNGGNGSRPADKEIADLLRNVADEARRARTGERDD